MVDGAMPHLLDKDALSMTETMVSDEDAQCYGSSDRHLKTPENKYGEAERRLCKWHKVKSHAICYFVVC